MTEAKLSELDNPLYSLAHLTLINCTPAELVYVAARAGYDAVSPRFITMNVPGEFTHAPLDKAQVQATKTALATTGIKILDIELARISEDCDPREFEAALELGGELGAERGHLAAERPQLGPITRRGALGLEGVAALDAKAEGGVLGLAPRVLGLLAGARLVALPLQLVRHVAPLAIGDEAAERLRDACGGCRTEGREARRRQGQCLRRSRGGGICRRRHEERR